MRSCCLSLYVILKYFQLTVKYSLNVKNSLNGLITEQLSQSLLPVQLPLHYLLL